MIFPLGSRDIVKQSLLFIFPLKDLVGDHSLPIQDHYFTVSQPQGKFCWFSSLLLKYYMEFLLSLQERIKISILELFFFQMLPPKSEKFSSNYGELHFCRAGVPKY